MKIHTILIVDDQAINRKILHRLLESEYQILEAENGQMALDILQENYASISAVLLDIVMPVLDGYGVLRAMQEDTHLSKIPVIVSSQKDGDEDEIKALSLGAQDFIAKPYKRDIIRHRLGNTIRLRETAAIANKAEKDELTGLLNKQFFASQVSDVLLQNPDTEYDIICFDIERFKLVNDAYGTATGDKLLQYMASILDESPLAILSSRFAADHFYQLIPRQRTNLKELFLDLLERLRAFPIEMKINVNSGIYQVNNIQGDVINMCDRAKLAADINRNRADVLYTYYDDSARQKLMEEQFIMGSMKTGLLEHQFQVYYQPKYDLHTEMVVGAEALVRWIHPEKGFLSPGAFIPVFEKNGFITQLDRYVWEEACKNIREWMDNGLPPVPISVNVSRADIFNPHLPEIILGLVRKYEIPLQYLHLEITESAYTDNPEQIIEVVEKLHELGFTIEMDDFGSGYSSLNMLAELPVDILKLDMRFVQMETTHSSGRGIMSFVISLAKWMKLSVIAEGVETAEQIDTLRSMDCNYVQGFYYARPMPKEEFEHTLKTVAVVTLKEAEDVSAEKKKSSKTERSTDEVMLIVDDIEVNRAVLASIFEAEYHIVEKENGEQALTYLRGNYDNVKVILTDLLMPVMDGFQLLEHLKAEDNLCNIPIIVTSQGDMTAESKALDMGADDFVSKPYSPQIVEHRVHNIVQMYQVHDIQEQELSITRKREQTLMESIPGGVAIYHLKKNGKLATEYVSDGLARLCGYCAEEFLEYIREDARVNVVAEDIPRLVLATQKSMKENTLIHELQHLYTKDKTIIPVRLDANVLFMDDIDSDDVAILYAVHTRVSHETESIIQEQNRYRYILDNLDVAYFEMDYDNSFYASDKFSLYVLSEEKPINILEDNISHESVHPEDLPILFEFFHLKQSNLPKASVTLRLKMKDGSYRFTEMMGFFEYNNEGLRIKTIGVFRDVDSEWQNQNRKLEEALYLAKKANDSKADFLARMSHEMRTPLNGILGLTSLMEGKEAGADIFQDIEELKQSGHYLLELINDSLDVSTIEKGKMQLHPTVCDGKTAFQNVIFMAKPGMDAKRITFNLQTGELPFTRLYIDVGRVEQAVLNVLSNAIKFTPEGGTIDFFMENISQEDGIITDRIVIRDNGIGMESEFLPHIFEPFTQEHSDAKSIYNGSGLGMTIAKQCVELMGGTISVSSEKGKGTEVSIILPMKVASRRQLAQWSNEKQSEDLKVLKGKHVLLCEDHPLNAQIAIRLLEKNGVVVEHAENGKIGVSMFNQSLMNYYDAVIMDIRMPVMDGLEATRKIRSLKRKDAKNVPIIAMTANAMHEDVKNSINAGMTEHLGKPVEPVKLFGTLAKAITAPNPYAGKKVLVVDDIEINRAFVKKAVEKTYTVLEAGSGKEALEILEKEENVVAVVTDIQMPVMDGKELIKNLRSEDKYDNIAILANTIYGDHRQEDELLALGANDFVYKPTSAQVIMMRLQHVLRNMDE